MKRLSPGMMLAVMAIVCATACADNANQAVVTTAVESSQTRLPDFDGPEELDEAIVGFGLCVEQAFPIVVRYRPDAFIGLVTEVGSQRQDESDLVDAALAECNEEFDLDRRTSAYQGAHPISAAQDLELFAGFVACANAVSPTMSELISDADLGSRAMIAGFLFELTPDTAALTSQELVAVSNCDLAMTGPARVFSNGHSWFQG